MNITDSSMANPSSIEPTVQNQLMSMHHSVFEDDENRRQQRLESINEEEAFKQRLKERAVRREGPPDTMVKIFEQKKDVMVSGNSGLKGTVFSATNLPTQRLPVHLELDMPHINAKRS